ncbi:hypothetical protein [Streptomyces sp. NPDC056452]|uniref:hypothetical protein n=1 Tax=Streptomyces sp. NPDC056452 TaxID=3345821 RepID=UPI00367B3DAA
MHVIRATLAGPPQAAHGVPAVLTDLVWAHTTAAHGLEHLRAKASDDGMDLYFFLRATSEAAALGQAHAILTSARTPLRAHGYTVAAPLH